MRSRASFRVVLVSGAICSGKSSLVDELRKRHGAEVVRTRDLILGASPKAEAGREALQRAGERLDRLTKGEWVAEALQGVIDAAQQSSTPSGIYVVDCVRTQEQVNAIRKAHGS